jgi:hypothetical protein
MGASFSASIQQLWFAVYAAYTRGKASRNTSGPTMTNMLRTNFLEPRVCDFVEPDKSEVRRRIHLPRTPVNKEELARSEGAATAPTGPSNTPRTLFIVFRL